jgi:vitamin B12 transport system substrate-binding protein
MSSLTLRFVTSLVVLGSWLGSVTSAAQPNAAPSSNAQPTDSRPRVVSLTPHATEMLFAAGAGSLITATVQASDHPAAALGLPKLGDGLNTSAEAVLAWQPDWVIGWPSALMDRLESLGIQTLVVDPKRVQDIPNQIEQLGQALGTSPEAQAFADGLRSRIRDLNIAPPLRTVRVAVLASADGEFALGRHALINDALSQCGATNVFSGSRAAAPAISQESLLAVQPDLVLGGQDTAAWIQTRFRFESIPADWLYRPGPRFVLALERICAATRQVGQSNPKR